MVPLCYEIEYFAFVQAFQLSSSPKLGFRKGILLAVDSNVADQVVDTVEAHFGNVLYVKGKGWAIDSETALEIWNLLQEGPEKPRFPFQCLFVHYGRKKPFLYGSSKAKSVLNSDLSLSDGNGNLGIYPSCDSSHHIFRKGLDPVPILQLYLYRGGYRSECI